MAPGERIESLPFVLRVGERHYLFAAEGTDDVVLINDAFQFRENAPWHNAANAFDVNGNGLVEVNDAIALFGELRQNGPREVPWQHVVHRVQTDEPDRIHFFLDVNGDGWFTAEDPLAVVRRLNELSLIRTDPAEFDGPLNTELVDRVFEQVRSYAGDANLDGRFDSSDLVLVFKSGEYEDGVSRNSTWSDGD